MLQLKEIIGMTIQGPENGLNFGQFVRFSFSTGQILSNPKMELITGSPDSIKDSKVYKITEIRAADFHVRIFYTDLTNNFAVEIPIHRVLSMIYKTAYAQ